jgi:hypothetical protein
MKFKPPWKPFCCCRLYIIYNRTFRVQFSVETKVAVKNNSLLGLEKGSRCHLQSKMELKLEYNLILKILNRIKEAV